MLVADYKITAAGLATVSVIGLRSTDKPRLAAFEAWLQPHGSGWGQQIFTRHTFFSQFSQAQSATQLTDKISTAARYSDLCSISVTCTYNLYANTATGDEKQKKEVSLLKVRGSGKF